MSAMADSLPLAPSWWHIQLQRCDPPRNVQRHYSISWEPCLFYPQGALVRRWGRIGGYTRVHTPEPCASPAEGIQRGAQLLRRRLRRGYRIQAVDGPAPRPGPPPAH